MIKSGIARDSESPTMLGDPALLSDPAPHADVMGDTALLGDPVTRHPLTEPAGTLIISAGSRRLTFLPGSTVSIGRDPANDVVLDSGSVSRRHAQVAWRDGGWVFSDIGSTQGSFAGAAAVRDLPVRGPVTVRLGQGTDAATVDFDIVGAAPVSAPVSAAPISPPPVSPAPSPSAGQTALRPGGALAGDPGAARTEIGAAGPVRNVLVVSSGDQRRMLLAGQTLDIGRESDNGLVLAAATVSRHHARIDDQAGRWVLTDLGSSAGTWHEGELITTIALSGRQDLVLGDPTTGDTITVEAPMSGAPGSGLISNRGFGAAPAGAVSSPPANVRSGGAVSTIRSRRGLAVIAVAVVCAVVLALVLVRITGGSSTPSEDALARATVRLATPDGSGSGVIIDRARGLIITNAHVAAPAAVGQGVTGWQFSDEADPNPDLIEVDVTSGRDQASEPRFKARVVRGGRFTSISRS